MKYAVQKLCFYIRVVDRIEEFHYEIIYVCEDKYALLHLLLSSNIYMLYDLCLCTLYAFVVVVLN